MAQGGPTDCTLVLSMLAFLKVSGQSSLSANLAMNLLRWTVGNSSA